MLFLSALAHSKFQLNCRVSYKLEEAKVLDYKAAVYKQEGTEVGTPLVFSFSKQQQTITAMIRKFRKHGLFVGMLLYDAYLSLTSAHSIYFIAFQ